MSEIPSYKELTKDINQNLREYRQHQAPTAKAFGELAAAATANGALSTKTKELIALAIGVALRCDGCIGFHAKALAQLGATLEEVEETLNMNIYLGGGPSLMYTANALAAFKEFSKDSAPQ